MAEKACIICGLAFETDGRALTCSVTCSASLRKKRKAKLDAAVKSNPVLHERQKERNRETLRIRLGDPRVREATLAGAKRYKESERGQAKIKAYSAVYNRRRRDCGKQGGQAND